MLDCFKDREAGPGLGAGPAAGPGSGAGPGARPGSGSGLGGGGVCKCV